jgi:hypothetical protein
MNHDHGWDTYPTIRSCHMSLMHEKFQLVVSPELIIEQRGTYKYT